MPRPLRIEFPGAIYHLLNRGDRREPIFADDLDRRCFLITLGEACGKTGWQIHAFCLMENHFHLVTETPQANLVVGMKWFLGTYTGRFNRRHRLCGHLFSGRYKSLLIDEQGRGYLRRACDYVHLNPWRAGLLSPGQPLSAYVWSSYPLYLQPRRRPVWLRVDRLLGEHGLLEDSVAGRREFGRRVEARREEEPSPQELAALRSGWWLGGEDFPQRLSEGMARSGPQNQAGPERRETDQELARRLVAEWLATRRWTTADLESRPKKDPAKVELARLLRRTTPMSHQWIADQVRMGTSSYVRRLLGQDAPGFNC